MPTKRNLGVGLIEMGDALGGYFQQKAKQQALDQAQQNAIDRQNNASSDATLKMLLEKALGSPADARRLATAGLLPDSMKGLNPDAQTLNSPLASKIDAADTLSKLPTEEGIKNEFQGPKQNPPALFGGFGPTMTALPTGGGDVDALKQLIAQRATKKAALEAQAPRTKVSSYNPVTGANEEQYYTTQNMPTGPVQTGPTPGQAGSNEATKKIAALTPGVIAAESNEAGSKKAAEEKAALPFQIKLAQTRANTALLNQESLDTYKREHPHATAQELNRVSNAKAALGAIADDRAMLDEMDKRGMLGPLAGRGYDIASGKIKSENLFKNPDDARLAADFFSNMRLTTSLAAVTHGGARGGGSPQMAAIFDRILNGVGDKSLTSGQLDAMERFMQRYATTPGSQLPDTVFDQIPGMNPNDPANLLQQLRDRKK